MTFANGAVNLLRASDFPYVLFNDTVRCWEYIPSVTDEWIITERRWNCT